MVHRSDVVLEEVLDAIALIEQEFAGHTRASFETALFLQRGTERSLEIISEAVRHLPDPLLELRPDISWSDVRSLGNRIRHEYWRVDPALIWSIVVDDLPALRAAVADLLRRLGPLTVHRGYENAPRRASNAVSVFLSRQAMVIGPTPPGTGVIAPATSTASA